MEILFQKKTDAESVLKRLKELISRYDFVAVNDLKQLLGHETGDLGRSEGWTSLDEAKIVKVESQWSLKLPDPDRIG